MFAKFANRRRARPRAMLALALLAILAIVWAAVWFTAAWWLDRTVGRVLAEAAGRGTVILCPGREAGGFPISLHLRCDAVVVQDGSRRAELGGALARASLLHPTTATVEVVSPAKIETPDGVAALAWTDARLRIGAGLRGLAQVAVDAGDFRAVLPAGTVSVHDINLAVTGNADGGSSVRADAEGLLAKLGATALPPLDGAFTAKVSEPPHRLMRRGAQPGLQVSNIGLAVQGGGLHLRASGDLSLGPDRLLDGSLTITLAGFDKLPALLAALPQRERGLGNAAAGALMAVGRPTTLDGEPAREVVLEIERGAMRFGFIALGHIPPL